VPAKYFQEAQTFESYLKQTLEKMQRERI